MGPSGIPDGWDVSGSIECGGSQPVVLTPEIDKATPRPSNSVKMAGSVLRSPTHLSGREWDRA